MGARILVVDDEERIRKLLTASLGRSGHDVSDCANAEDAFRQASTTAFDVVIMDLNMPGLNGLEGIRSIKLVKPDQHVIVLTGYATERIREQALEAGAAACLFKPAKLEEIEEAVQRLLGEADG